MAVYKITLSGNLTGHQQQAFCSFWPYAQKCFNRTPISDRQTQYHSYRGLCAGIRYDMIRDAILTCAQKWTQISLINRVEPKTKKWKKVELKVKTHKLRSINKQSGESVESVCVTRVTTGGTSGNRTLRTWDSTEVFKRHFGPKCQTVQPHGPNCSIIWTASLGLSVDSQEVTS